MCIRKDRGMAEGKEVVEYWWSKAEAADVLVFDLDGTLINSDLANFLSYDAAISQVLSIRSQMAFDPNNRTTRETIKKQFPAICSDKLYQVVAEKERLYCNYLPQTVLNLQIISILERSIGKEIILVTNSRKKRADMLLKYHGIAKRFTHILYREDAVILNKYQLLLSKICGNNKSIVVFEDDVFDISRAIAAGINSNFIIKVGADDKYILNGIK